tara:strand:+ start:201 stop:461 length:261 start_codon:yes stop_codon:yes gene_type:complete
MDKKIPFNLLKISPATDDNPLGMTVEVQPEFEEWFVKAHGLSEWDEEKFSTWFKNFLGDAVKDSFRVYERSEQQQVDVWESGEENE